MQCQILSQKFVMIIINFYINRLMNFIYYKKYIYYKNMRQRFANLSHKLINKTYINILLLTLLTIIRRTQQTACWSQGAYTNCWRNGDDDCWQNNSGSSYSCSDNTALTDYFTTYNTNTYIYSYSCACGNWVCYDNSCWDPDWGYYCCSGGDSYSCACSESINMIVRYQCSSQCATCNGRSNPLYDCLTCNSGSYKWNVTTRCYPYCPSYSIGAARGSSNDFFNINSIGQFKITGSRFCQRCDSKCNFCNGYAATDCYSCVGNYPLIDEQSVCLSRFDTPVYPVERTCYPRQCLSTASTCPTYYYFRVTQTNIINSYTSWSNAACQSNNHDDSCVQYRRISSQYVCYFCNGHCQTCNGPNQDNCQSCTRYSYLWNQHGSYCTQSCPLGVYTWNSGDWRGEYINEGSLPGQIVTSTGVGDRTCKLCNSNCRWCRYNASWCLQCRDGNFLLDLHTECMARYIDPGNCSVCQSATYDMCRNALYNVDRKCISSCPTHFYFPIYRVNPGNTDYFTGSTRYENYTRMSVANQSYIDGNENDARSANIQYRLGTNLCMLCDYRCITCSGPLNTQCTRCRNGIYLWMSKTVCEEFCPIGQYIARDQPSPINETECRYCDNNCLTCEVYSVNCSSCKGADYAFYPSPGTTVAFLYRVNNSYSECKTDCPTSTNIQTQIGYYGSFRTLTCYPCPTPCSNCNINIIKNRYPDISCGTDDFCSDGLVCTDCLLGYALVGPKCIPQNNCREYAYYDEPAVSTAWSAVNCKCLDGYSLSSYAKCHTRCHISCQTCTGTASNNCATCYSGQYLSSGQCLQDTSKALYQYTWVRFSALTNISASSTTFVDCGGYWSVFGYEDQNMVGGTTTYNPTKNFGYSFTIPSLNYYAIRIKLALLFVDEYNARGAVYISRDAASNAPVWSWNYDTKSAYGEQLCATNKMDYVLFATAELPTRNRTSENFYITSNQHIIITNLGKQIYWGFGGFFLTVLKCHSDCSYCTGPTANECLTCSTTGYTPVNGTCVCNIAANYYKWQDGICRTGCPTASGWFRDDYTRSCVHPPDISNCTAPTRFGDSMGTSGYGTCVADCPSGYYASGKQMKCTTNCWADSPSQYRFADGASRSCESVCPSGYIKDILNRDCVLKCPTSYYFQIENSTTDPTCVSKCLTGWEYDGMQLCVTDCPSGYFKQQTDPANPATNRNKCVSVCVNAFGDPDTGFCTLSCPFPKYADLAKKLCLETCSDPTYFAQVALSNLNRTCVPACESGQWGNPFTKKCSNYTTDCPDGYYANFATTMCVANCTTAGYVAENSTKSCRTSCLTGFAHWESRTCVRMCPSDPPMFGYLPTKICVSSCNYSSTFLYGDAQANRTCVQTCSASPSPTFGQNSTSLCVDKCSVSTEYADPADIYRRCVTDCSSVPRRYAYSDSTSVTRQCVLVCPDSYFGEIHATRNSGVCVKTCLAPNFGDPESNWCRPTCKWGYFGWPSGTRPCLQKCPRYWFGVNETTDRVCVPVCPSGYWGDIQTSMCYNVKTSCSNDTYADAQKFLCVVNTNCTSGTFADPFTKGCEAACSNGYFADSRINTCVYMCSDVYDEYGQQGICRYSCILDRFADPQANRTCVRNCSRSPLALFGIVAARRICVTAANCPTDFYGNNNTLTCVNPCSGSLPFGDPISKMCVSDCPDGYYGDSDTNLCVQKCNFATLHYADNQTGNCETLCTLGTFGVNATSADTIPSCQLECPSGFARDSDRVCVSNCGPGLYGDPITRRCYADPFDCSFGYFANSVSHMCVLPADCQTVSFKHYFAQNSTKTCVEVCDAPNYGDSKDWFCNPVCNETFFGQNSTRLCIADCTTYSSYAQTQNNLCVARCSDSPIKHYAQDRYHKCVEAKDCPIYITVTPNVQTFAQNSTQQCVVYCGTNQWADSTTFRCVAVCPNGYYKDDSTGHNLCSSSCPGTYRFRDNSTKSCVSICPASNLTFGYSDGDQCVYTCPDGFFAQVDTDRRCVPVCKDGTWGNKITKVCITQPLTECPTLTWADNFTHKCEQVCDSGSGYYGYNVTRLCVTACPSPTFAWDGTRVCIDICPASLTGSGYFGDPTTSPTRKCFLTCQTNGYYRDIAASRICVTDCTYNSSYKTYKDPTTASCEVVCSTYPSVRYADDNLKSCETACAGSLRKNDATQTCVSVCPLMYDPTTDKCVDICPSQSTSGPLFANLTNNNNTCIVASTCPTGTYADFNSRTCTSSCPAGTYISGKYCVYYCPNDQFMDQLTRSCVAPANCSSGLYADNQTRSCVSQCIGTFAETTLRRCIDVCYGGKYGDPFTRKCQTSCSQGLIINTQNSSCVANCIIGLYANPVNSSCSSTCPSPYYADNNTMSCVTSCGANPMTFASVSSLGVRECVSTCPTNKMHDMINRICVDVNSCPANSYSYSINMSCVAFCPAPSFYQLGKACVTNCSSDSVLKYADDLSRKCVSTCPTGSYKETNSYKCVSVCPTAPAQQYISVSQNKCTPSCPDGSYADPVQLMCVTVCSLTPRMFAQPVNRVCVQQCPLAQNSFADPTTGGCVTSCPTNYFADSRDRTCKTNCSFLFADSTTSPKSCVENCSVNLYADELTFRCVSVCPANYYKHTPTRRCVQSCPFGYYLNSLLSLCVVRTNCPSSSPYADNLTRLCVANCSNGQFGYLASGTTTGGACVYTCASPFFSNPRTGKCELSCPSGLFSNTDNNTCSSKCPYNKFMDSVNNKCVSQCPASDNLYADLYNRSCLTGCDPAKFTFADDLTRVCEQTCSGDQYADEATQKCVGPALCSGGLYSDPHYKRCVQTCYNGTYGYLGRCIADCPTLTDDVYASQDGFVCVAAADCPDGTFADPVLHKCVQFCPIESATFADIDTKKCLTECNAPLFADNLTRQCVETCPNVSKLYGDTVNKKCVLFCPFPFFADETTNLCVQNCPNGYFADSSTLTCVAKCPEDQYGNNVSNVCQPTCPSSPTPHFGDPDTRMCVLYCPDGKFADVHNNRECQPKCIGNVGTFAQNSTGQCLGTCLTGFANIRTKQCIALCTAGFQGYNKICYQNCPNTSPTVFADNSTHLCVQNCPNGTFADLSTLKCVKICPISQSTFGDTVNWVCTDQCTGSYFADTSTRMCVLTCPQVPALFGKLPERICVSECLFGFFADNSTRMCSISCPFGTYADNITMKCQSQCASDPYMYGENITNTCVLNCWADRDMYADNSTRTCVYLCTSGTFADRTRRQCVETCPLGYFAVNRTRRCEPVCEAGSFADSLLRICVQVCSVNPIFYGDIDKVCKPECPTNSYGNPLTQQCVHDSMSISTCPTDYFGDRTSKLCVQVCPMKFDLYADPSTKKCETSCSGGLVADNSTMRCVVRCPEYPSYFANLATMRCIPFCPNNTFADPISRTCVANCPANSYADSSTWRCVTNCPKIPLTFADDTTWSCVVQCPTDYFSDNSTQKCVSRCPDNENTFARNSTRQCVRVCPSGSFADTQTRKCILRCYGGKYSDNSTRTCVNQCPKYPAYYADPTTDQCVSVCPPFYFSFEDDRTCVQTCPSADLYRQNSTTSCVKKCNFEQQSYADNLTGYCVLRCSVDSWADPTIRVCVAVCPNQPLLYADNTTQTCVVQCPGATFGENTTRTCVDSCPVGSLSLPQRNLCVRYCPVGYYAYNVTQFCFQVCPGVYYGDPSTRSCVLTCPLNQLLYADNSSKTCVSYCPPNSYADKKSVSCVDVCPDADLSLFEAQTYAADYNNVCVEECALPNYAYLPTKKCITSCPNPYYNNLQDHTCKLCPTVCLSCTVYDVCTTCTSSRFLENGRCVLVCSTGYYANLVTMKCVPSKLCRPFYGVNSTNTCTSVCPAGSFANNQMYRCDACQITCLTCLTWTNCLTCNTSMSAMYQNYCYRFCEVDDNNTNSINQFYYSPDNTTCHSTCPNGTYLFVIFCKNCSSPCQTCEGNSTNCTRCLNGLYLQGNQCVSQCASGFKPNISRVCVYCGSSCGESLTFQTNITQVDGQNTVYVTFSDDIILTGDPNQIFALQTTSRRRLLANGYQIVVVDSKTIKIIIDSTSSSTGYTVQILKPENIQDVYGNLPEKVRDEIQIDLANTYTTSINTAPSGFSTYFTIMAMVCVISFLFDIELMKFLQLVYLHYFVVMILPPQLSKVLLAFKYSMLNYLPTLYSVPEAVLRENVPGKVYDAIGDYSFLRNGGFVLTPLVVIVALWIGIKILSVPEINRFKNFRLWCKQQLDEKFKYAVLVEWLNIVFLNTIFFIFMQMKDYNQYDSFSLASIVVAHLMLAFVVLTFAFLVYRVISFFRQYPKLSQNLKKATELLLQENEYHKLNSSNIFLFEMKKIDLRNLYYPKVNNENILPFRNIYRFNFLPLCCIFVTYLRSIILSAIIAFGPSTLVQMSLCIPLNIACLLYFSRARPYSFKFNKRRVRNYVAIFHEAALIVLELLFLALGILDRDNKSSFEKESFSNVIIYYLCIVCSVSFLYFLFRVGVQVYRRIWMPFTETEIFRVNFPQKYAQLHGTKKDNMLKGIDPKAKQALRNMIRNYKKHKSILRPNQDDKANPQLPMKYKITYFDRDASSVGSKSSLSKSQKRKMVKQIFGNEQENMLKDSKLSLPQNYQQMTVSQNTQPEYEEYQQQIEIKAKDLANYVKNADELLRIKKLKQQQAEQN